MANRSRLQVLKGEYRPAPKLVVPLVSSLHPATTILSQVVKSTFTSALSMDPVLEVALPPSSFIVSYTLGNSCHIWQVRKVTVDLPRLAGLSIDFPVDRPAIYGRSTIS